MPTAGEGSLRTAVEHLKVGHALRRRAQPRALYWRSIYDQLARHAEKTDKCRSVSRRDGPSAALTGTNLDRVNRRSRHGRHI